MDIKVSNNSTEVAESAINYELEGRKILSDAEEKAVDPLSKATFRFLADQELRHIEAIKSFAQSLSGEGAFDQELLLPATREYARDQIKGLFAEFKSRFEETSGRDEERQSIYKVALDMEHCGHDFYHAAAEQAADETAKKLYSFLAEEESRHFELIQETATFLKQPDAIMAVEERWMQI